MDHRFAVADRPWRLLFFAARPEPWFSHSGLLIGGFALSLLLGWLVFALRMILGLRRQVQEALRLGQYTLGDKLGEGGMGAVYEARHALLRRPTAIKLIEAHDEHRLRRFEREVQLTSQLTHPNTVAVYDYGRTPDGILYYAMEYLEGLTLERLVGQDGPQPAGRVVHLLVQVCGALEEAHQVGLIHRDIKPANLMLVCRGTLPDFVKVLDFGLVKEFTNEREPTIALTNTQVLLGTPTYMSPEAIESKDVDGRGDLYALGAVGYFLLTGVPPFDADNVVQVCLQHLYEPVVPPSQRLGRAVPAALERILLHCLQKDPGDRPQTAGELRQALLDCGLRDQWTSADARAWWDRLGRKLVRQSGQKSASSRTLESSRTLSVDLEGRTQPDNGVDQWPSHDGLAGQAKG
jgi:serine/threonine protein kinase